MGSTVTTGKRIAAFSAPNGDTIYLMFEETFEKNVHPHTPDWSAVTIGRLPEILRRIFSHASSCEGGMLQSRNGRHITPEGYIKGWMSELASPIEFDPDLVITLRVSDRFYATVPTESADFAFDALTGIGRSDIAEQLKAGESVDIHLGRDTEVVLALYGNRQMPVWRVIRSFSRYEEKRRPDLGYMPSSSKGVALAPPPPFIAVDEDDGLLTQRADGSWYYAGWAYEIISDLVKELWNEEMQTPGIYARKIKAYRDAIRNAPRLSMHGVKVAVNYLSSGVPLEPWQLRSISEIEAANQVLKTEAGFIVQPTHDNLYHVKNCLPAACTTWLLPVNNVPVCNLSLF